MELAEGWEHWIEMGKKLGNKAPKIFHVNWFRKDDNDNFMWPGFGDNMRVLLWILDRCAGKVDADESAIGYIPKAEDIDVTDLDLDADTLKALLTVDKAHWFDDVNDPETGIKAYFEQFGDKLPAEIKAELDTLVANLNK